MNTHSTILESIHLSIQLLTQNTCLNALLCAEHCAKFWEPAEREDRASGSLAVNVSVRMYCACLGPLLHYPTER